MRLPRRLGRVEVWVSLYWDEPYNTEGAFTLEVRPTEEKLSLFREGRWLRRSDSDVPMRHLPPEQRESGQATYGHRLPGDVDLHQAGQHQVVKNEKPSGRCADWSAQCSHGQSLEVGAAVGFDTTCTAGRPPAAASWTT